MLCAFSVTSRPSGPKASGLEEAPDPRAAVQELAVAGPLLLVGREHRVLFGRLERLDDLLRPCLQLRARRRGDELLDDDETVAVVRRQLIDREHATSVWRGGQAGHAGVPRAHDLVAHLPPDLEWSESRVDGVERRAAPSPAS